MIDAEEEWRTWRGWLGDDPKGRTTFAEVVEMLAFRQIWNGFALIHDEAPEQARKNATFVWWVRWNYARAMGSAIRRQVDVGSDVISVGRLIDRVWRYPTVLTRERFVAMNAVDVGWAHEQFTKVAGPGDYINPEIPARDLEDLRDKTATIRVWVNKAVAHTDARRRDAPPLADLHVGVDVVFDLFNEYRQLIRGESTSRGVTMTIWPVVFRTPWITDDQWPDISRRVDEFGRPEW